MTTIEIDEDEVWEVYTVNKYPPYEIQKAYERRDKLNNAPRKPKRLTYIVQVGYYYVKVMGLRPIRPPKLQAFEKRNRFVVLAAQEVPGRTHNLNRHRSRQLQRIAHSEFQAQYPENTNPEDLAKFYSTWVPSTMQPDEVMHVQWDEGPDPEATQFDEDPDNGQY